MEKLTDKKIKKIIQDCSFTIEGKEWRVFKKSEYYQWIREHREGIIVEGMEWTLENCVRDSARQFMQAIRFLNL